MEKNAHSSTCFKSAVLLAIKYMGKITHAVIWNRLAKTTMKHQYFSFSSIIYLYPQKIIAEAKYCLMPLNELAQIPSKINRLNENHVLGDSRLTMLKYMVRVKTDKKEMNKWAFWKNTWKNFANITIPGSFLQSLIERFALIYQRLKFQTYCP